MRALCLPTPVAQERSAATDLETMLLNSHGGGRCFAGSISRFLRGVFFVRGLTHTTDQCRTLDESFPFLPTGWQAEHIGDQFILGPGPPARPQDIPGPAVR